MQFSPVRALLSILLLGSAGAAQDARLLPASALVPLLVSAAPPVSNLAYLPPPSNDDCSSPNLISGFGLFPFDDTAATTGTQGQHECTVYNTTANFHDVWYVWTASSTGIITFSTCAGQSSTETKMAVYPGTGCPADGASIACSGSNCNNGSVVTFSAVAGQQYMLQLGVPSSVFPGGSGTFSLFPQSSGQPSNDSCSSATVVSGSGPFPFDTTNATTGAEGQNESVCGGLTSIYKDVWYVWTASASSPILFSTCGQTTVRTKIAVYPGAGCPANGIGLACNAVNCAPQQASLVFNAVAGQQYTLQIGDENVVSNGMGTFTLTSTTLPNDDCSTPAIISGNGPFSFDTTHATTGTQGQTESLCNAGGSTAILNDVWFAWTTNTGGMYRMSTCGQTNVDTKIAVYRVFAAGCPNSVNAIACSDDSNNCSPRSSLAFVAQPSTIYLVQIGTSPHSSGGGTGTFTIDLQTPGAPVPANLNVDMGTRQGSPSATYGGAAGKPGYWNSLPDAETLALNDLDGVASNVVLSQGTGNVYPFDQSFNPGPQGDDAALMNDFESITQLSAPSASAVDWTFSNLFGGDYDVYTYAWPYTSVVSSVTSSDGPQATGGPWPGAQVLGVTYALHHFTGVPNGGSITMRISTGTGFTGPASLDGFQLVFRGSPVSVFCSGDGSGTPCPCGNMGFTGHGCANSFNAAGAHLSGIGNAILSGDRFVLRGSGMPTAGLALYFQGSVQANGGMGTVFEDGLRCAGGTVRRLGTKLSSASASQYPGAGDVPISVNGAIPPSGGTRTYQAWYRNSSGPCGYGSNLTNGVQVTWVP